MIEKRSNAAVSEHAGKSSFHLTALPDASSLLLSKKTDSTYDKYMKNIGVIEVDVVTIDDIAQKNLLTPMYLLIMKPQRSVLNILKYLQFPDRRAVFLDLNQTERCMKMKIAR